MGSLTGGDNAGPRIASGKDGRPAIEARGVTYRYRSGRTGVEALDLVVHSGETVVLLGPNGSGKTTVLRLLAGDLPPVGELTHRCGPARRDRLSCTGYAPDSAAQVEELTGRENARLFARAFGAGDDAADDLLVRFGLAGDADDAVSEYSFGMRRKLALVQAFAHSPAVLLLDEPSTGLDPAAIVTLHEVLRERAAAGAAVVIATNDSRIPMMADTILFIHRGRALASGSPRELLQSVAGATRIEITLDGVLPQVPVLPAGIESTASSSGLVFSVRDGPASLPVICQALVAAGARIRRVDVREPGFDDVFRSLTGEELARDGDATGPLVADDGGEAVAGGFRDRQRRQPPWRRR